MSKASSAGGKARALQQKEEAKQRIDNYNKDPNLCLCCNKPIFAPYDKKLRDTTKKKFCSKSCASKDMNKRRINNPLGITNCKKIIDELSDEMIIDCFNNSNSIIEFSRKLGYQSKIDYKNKDINDKLLSLGLDINLLKKEMPKLENFTKKQLFDRYTQWQTARSAIQKMARQIFEKSNKLKKCIVCGYDKHYEVAHIKAVSEFNDDDLISKINDIDNLIALCPNHHWEYDNKLLDLKSYIYNFLAGGRSESNCVS